MSNSPYNSLLTKEGKVIFLSLLGWRPWLEVLYEGNVERLGES
jgi:hypothetical protein